MTEQDKIAAAEPPLDCRVSGLRWPRGKYNGRRITGLSVKVRFDVAMFQWKPRASWDFGTPYFAWLFVIMNIEPIYHYLDR